MQSVIETPDYLADAKRAGLSQDEREEIVEYIARNPEAGDLIQGSGGARKVRFPSRAKARAVVFGLSRSLEAKIYPSS